MELLENNTRLLLDLAETPLTAREVDNLISRLAELRAAMEPPVPTKRPDAFTDPDLHITMEDEPAMTAAHLRDGRMRLWLRNRGFGWCAYNVSQQDARALGQYMLGRLGDTAPNVDLFGGDETKRH